MGQITATRNLVAIKVVRHAGQWQKLNTIWCKLNRGHLASTKYALSCVTNFCWFFMWDTNCCRSRSVVASMIMTWTSNHTDLPLLQQPLDLFTCVVNEPSVHLNEYHGYRIRIIHTSSNVCKGLFIDTNLHFPSGWNMITIKMVWNTKCLSELSPLVDVLQNANPCTVAMDGLITISLHIFER